MKPILEQLAQIGDISYLSYYFAEFIAQQANCEMDDLLALSAALVSEKNQQGDVCVVLDQYESQPLFATNSPLIESLPTGVPTESWQKLLLDSPCVGSPGDLAPLILEDGRLYLSRFWFYETQVANAILARLKNPVSIDDGHFVQDLNKLFPDVNNVNESTDQMAAVAIAARHRFSVISGGPGTGKTTTVVKLLALLLSQEPDMRIKLAAPTGKAAMRLVDSIRARLAASVSSNIGDGAIRDLIPTEASTIHRLLGYGNQKFKYSGDNQLAVDCIVIDEASMIDLTLMYHLLDALPQHSRVILLGDRDQLASVAAGNVLGDITGHGLAIGYTPSQNDFLNSIVTGCAPASPSVKYTEPNSTSSIANTIALLKHSYRFRSDSGIGQLATLINQGMGQQAIELLSTGGEHLFWHNDIGKTLSSVTLEWILSHYQTVIQAECINEALLAFENLRVLCAIRSGPFGVSEINRLITSQMLARGWIVATSVDQYSDSNYHGQPILITQNDYELNLFNGDIGMIWRDTLGRLRAYFRGADDSLRELPLQSLTTHEPAWAMTVHKSQGSEFDTVLLVLPGDEAGNALSCELLYTGATRARQTLYVHASAASVISSCRTITQRHSGLAQKLGWK
jgi:exodeoxyribonuclease V alpha subunit